MQLTLADRVTLVRAGLGGCVAVLVALSVVGAAPERSWVVVAIAVPMLLLDAVDGWVARHWDCATAGGAIFDAEVDAGVVLILSIAAGLTLGWWVLLIGLARYLYGAAARVWTWLEAPLPPSLFRKGVAAVQGVALTVALAPGTPIAVATTVVLLAGLLLAVSFATQAIEAKGLRPQPSETS